MAAQALTTGAAAVIAVGNHSLVLTGLKARGLLAADRNGKSDPYLSVKVDDKHKKSTKHRSDTLEPQWDETIS